MRTFDENSVFVDVRTPSEFEEAHAPNAINIPLDQIVNRVDEIRSMQRPVVLYCRSGNRSEMAAVLLRQKGMQNVTNGGGLEDVEKQLAGRR